GMPRACPVDGYVGLLREHLFAQAMPRACPVDGYVARLPTSERDEPRGKPVASVPKRAAQVETSVTNHGASPWHPFPRGPPWGRNRRDRPRGKPVASHRVA